MDFLKWRLKLGFSKVRAQKELHLSKQTVIDYESGKRKIKPAIIKLMAYIEKEFKENKNNAINRAD